MEPTPPAKGSLKNFPKSKSIDNASLAFYEMTGLGRVKKCGLDIVKPDQTVPKKTPQDACSHHYLIMDFRCHVETCNVCGLFRGVSGSRCKLSYGVLHCGESQKKTLSAEIRCFSFCLSVCVWVTKVSVRTKILTSQDWLTQERPGEPLIL